MSEPLTPFSPPSDYTVEPEFAPPTPRPIPACFDQGRRARQRRLSDAGFLVGGLLCLAAAQLPVVQRWGQYFVPLEILSWLGIAYAAVPLVRQLIALVRPSPLRYVRDGIPLVCRIRALALLPAATYHGQVVNYHVRATIEYADPATGDLVSTQDDSNRLSAHTYENYTTSYRVGDYATAVYLPGDRGPVRLYGFLDLRPDLGIVTHPGVPELTRTGVAARALAVASLIALPIWAIHTIIFYQPLGITSEQALGMFAVTFALFGLPAHVVAARIARRRRRARDRRNHLALAAGLPFEPPPESLRPRRGLERVALAAISRAVPSCLGWAVGIAVAFAANAGLDTSPARFHPVRVIRTDASHPRSAHDLFHEYKVIYHFDDESPDAAQAFRTTPEDLQRFQPDSPAVAELHAGRFGWTWLKSLRPSP